MEDEKLRELSKDFLFKNIILKAETDPGDEIQHKFKNGRTRIINVFKHSVKIIDENGNLLYFKILDIKHPLMHNAICYYNFLNAKHKPIVSLRAFRKYIEERDSQIIECEEFYKII